MNISTDQVRRFLLQQIKSGDIVIQLILVNIAIYLGLQLIAFIEWMLRLSEAPISLFIQNWFFLPASFNDLLITPYTLLTYMFFHASFLHLLVNVFMLYFFGKMIISLRGFKQVLPLYVLGGVFGGIFYVFFNHFKLVPMIDTPIAGASASIMALMAAVTLIQPNFPLKFFLLFDVKLKWLMFAFALLNILGLSNAEGAGPGIIHIGGMLWGFIFMYLESRQISVSKPFNGLVNRLLALFNKRPQPKVSFINKEKVTPSPKAKTNADDSQEKIDAILDKISANGYESLSREEKDFLFKASKK